MIRARVKSVLRGSLRRLRKGRGDDASETGLRGRYPDIEEAFFDEIYSRCAEFTMTPPERAFAFHEAVKYVVRSKVEGDIVECGVWRGGSAMVAALTLLSVEETGSRRVVLYDTFQGMSRPTPKDVDYRGESAMETWRRGRRGEGNDWCFASMAEVERNLAATGFPMKRVWMIPGRVEDTMPASLPERVAVLRLDTDWYESTVHELRHLFPRLSQYGVLLVDDYGYWRGAREATDQFMEEQGIRMLLHRVDATCRVGIKVDRWTAPGRGSGRP